MKNLLSIQDLTLRELNRIFELTEKFKENRKLTDHLKGKSIALLFYKPSTRTRLSTEVAIYELGGNPVYMYSETTQLARGESIKDTAKVLSKYVHAIGARVYEHKDLEELAKYATVPVFNLLSNKFHPFQIISDLFTIKERFESFKGIKLAYVGDGNNIANSLLLGCSKVGLDISVACPKGYWPSRDVIKLAKQNARNSKVEVLTDPNKAVKGSNIIYTDVHVSLGQKRTKKRLSDLKPYQVNKELVKHAREDYLFLHCLPRHKEEVVDEIFYSKHSIVFEQAANRLPSAKSILTFLLT